MAVTHGLAGTYRSQRSKCRCDACTEAHRKRQRDEMADRTARLGADPTLAPHGKLTTYRNWGCRCEPCTKDHSKACREYKQRRSR